jgi:hypothetical protein
MPDASRARQLEELECMLSMFPDLEEMEVPASLRELLVTGVSAGASDATPVRYSLHFQDLRGDGGDVPVLEIACPAAYPHSVVTFSVGCSVLSREEKEALNAQLQALAASAASTGEVVVLELYQHMSAFLSAANDRRSEASTVGFSDDTQLSGAPSADAPVPAVTEQVLGRRAIYFHHIIAPTKRQVVMEWALELQLSGFSKIGWPGVVIVEGAEGDVQEYVRRLQHLRWKQIVVRGEQTERGEGQSVEQMRKLPRGFREFPEKSGMAALAAACRDAGIEQLFLTTMKIYGRGEEQTDGDGGTEESKKDRGGSRGRGKR